MATIDELIASQEVELEAAQSRRDKSKNQVKAILAIANSEGRATLTEEEDAQVADLFAAQDQAKRDIAGIESKLETSNRVKVEERETERLAAETTATPAAAQRRPAYDQVTRVGAEERTYHPGTDRKGAMFLRDVAKSFLYNDVQSTERLSRHMHEERVERANYLTRAAGDTLTSNWTGLVVPQYLTDMKARAIANLRPFANVCNRHDLPPDGMSVNISQVTTASSVALQATQLTGVSATSIDDTLLTENVQTAAGQQTLSRQAIDRGTGIEETVMDDLFRRYATTLDSTLINQASTGLSALGVANAFTTTTPAWMSATAADNLYGKILGACSGVESALLAYGQPTHAIMNPRRWHWINSKVSAVWPGIQQPSIPVQSGGVNVAAGYDAGIRGILPNGLATIADGNVPINIGTATSQDEIYVVCADECHLWEDPSAPVFIRAEQAAAANLGVLLVLYGYFAYSFRRYANAVQTVGGTGLATPVFG